jgi:hypothetical protein
MATPQESVTTVNGRRCTRSRARTAATSTSLATSAAPEVTSAAASPPPEIISQAAQIQSSAAAQISSPPPQLPPSSTQADVPDVASTNAAAVSSAIGTDSPVSSSAPQPSALAIAPNSPPLGQDPAPGPPVLATPTAVGGSSSPDVTATSVAAESAAPLTTSSPTSSDSNNAAAISISSTLADPTNPAVPAISSVQSSIELVPEQPASSTVLSDPRSSDSPSSNQSQQPQSTQTGFPSGGSDGLISPEQGTEDGQGLTIGSGTGANIGGIVGGVLGGLFGLMLISGLLFFCLRKRRSREPFERWQHRMSEKEEASPGFFTKVKATPAVVAVFFATLRKDKAESAQNQHRSSTTSSIYSTTTDNQRARSISEPPSRLRQHLRDIGGRMPSLSRSRTLLQKKQDSFVVGSQSPFIGIVEDPVARNSKGTENPFADPDEDPLEPPKKLSLLNPDPKSPNLQREFNDGLQNQQRAPIAPKPATMSDRGSKDPFSSILDQLESYDGSGTPEWLKDLHRRSQSASAALQSHPPSFIHPSSTYVSADNPFVDPTDVPPVPTQPLPPNPPVNPVKAYYNPTANATSRASNISFYYGESGPSRPSTRMFATPPQRAGRQSDPFDLDRPEVLGFGAVSGRREVRASTVTRQNSRRRSSSVVNINNDPYTRSSADPGPLAKPNVKR